MSAVTTVESESAEAPGGVPAAVKELLIATAVHDRSTAVHTARVVKLARRVGRALGLDDRRLRQITLVAMLHDVGKTRVARRILDKQGPLNAEEWEAIRKHPEYGAELVASRPEVAHLAPAIRASHERWDGRGYPEGLAREDIPLASRISFVCDAYDAMVSDRPYRPAMPQGQALEEIGAEAGRQFCPASANALLELESPPWRVLGRPRP